MREDAHRLIVQALAATGRKAEASHHQDLVALLKRELNTEPTQPSLVAELAHGAVEQIARRQARRCRN
jgi:hypothetical protein